MAVPTIWAKDSGEQLEIGRIDEIQTARRYCVEAGHGRRTTRHHGRKKLEVPILVGPTQHSQGPERSPPARPAGAAFHLEVDRSRVRILERPTAKPISLVRDQIDGLGGAIVGFDAGSPQMVQPHRMS